LGVLTVDHFFVVVFLGLFIAVFVVFELAWHIVNRWWVMLLSCLGAIATGIVLSMAVIAMLSAMDFRDVGDALVVTIAFVFFVLGLLVPVAGGLGVAYGLRAMMRRREHES
jgi:hypothetical protein